MENNEQKECKCWCWGHHEGCRKHVLLRWVLGLAILLFVFWLGVKVGEFKTLINETYGMPRYEYRMMRGGYPSQFQFPNQNYGGYGMMQYRIQQNQNLPQEQNKNLPAQGQ